MVMRLHVNWHFLLDIHRNFDGVWLRDVHRDGIWLRYIYVVGDRKLDGVWHFLFYDEWNFLLNIHRIRLRNFNCVGLLDLNLNRNLHCVRDFFSYRDGIRLRKRIFYFMCDDGGLDVVLLLDLVSLVPGQIVMCEMLSEDAPILHGPAVFLCQRRGKECHKIESLRKIMRFAIFTKEADTVTYIKMTYLILLKMFLQSQIRRSISTILSSPVSNAKCNLAQAIYFGQQQL